MICCVILRSNKINCSHDLRESKVLDSCMFIFIRRNNIVKNHQLLLAFILNVRWQKQHLEKSLWNKCPSISFRHGASHAWCLSYIDLHYVLFGFLYLLFRLPFLLPAWPLDLPRVVLLVIWSYVCARFRLGLSILSVL